MSETPRNKPWMPALTIAVVLLAAGTMVAKGFPLKKQPSIPDDDTVADVSSSNVDSVQTDSFSQTILLIENILKANTNADKDQKVAAENLIATYEETHDYILAVMDGAEPISFRQCSPSNSSANFLESRNPEQLGDPLYNGFLVTDRSSFISPDPHTPRHLKMDIRHPDGYSMFIQVQEDWDTECPGDDIAYTVDITNRDLDDVPESHRSTCAESIGEVAEELGIDKILNQVDDLCDEYVFQ